jgi:tripartite-type tricarboxylate transporter receptor subunit TctC
VELPRLTAALSWLLLFSPLLAGSGAAAATHAYPERPVRLIVPYPAGGSGDVIARLIGQRLTASLGQAVIVDNRAGASGLVGTEIASRAAPDGYTVLLTTSTNAINVTLHPGLPYDVARDFEPVALLARGLQVLVVHPSIAATSLKEFVALVRARPSQLNYASSGSGTSGHLAMEVLKRAAGIDVTHVPYKGNAPALNDLIGGQVTAMFSNVVTVVGHVKGGRLRALGVSSVRRSVLAPDIPTIAESGFPGFEVIAWFGMAVPAGTPKTIVATLNAGVLGALAPAEAQERMLALGAEPVQDVKTPAQIAEFLKADIDKWRKMIRETGVHPD